MLLKGYIKKVLMGILSVLVVGMSNFNQVFAVERVAKPALSHAFYLPGVINSRDIGGYRTLTGKIIKKGKVFRTAALHDITAKGKQKLVKVGLTKIIDLRTGVEIKENPDPIIQKVRNIHRDILGADYPKVTLDGGIKGIYKLFVTSPFARKQFGLAVKDIITNPGASLYHCSQGKDRTGWLTVLIYEILGVKRQVIENDYLLSNEFWGVTHPDDYKGVTLTNLRTSYNMVREQYGNMHSYLTKGLGLTDKDLTKLRNKLLD